MDGARQFQERMAELQQALQMGSKKQEDNFPTASLSDRLQQGIPSIRIELNIDFGSHIIGKIK